MELTQLKWMDYSGSPILLLPGGLEKEWLGFYAEVPDAFEGIPDLEIDGQQYYIEDSFDFDHPRTDYDCICAEKADLFSYELEQGSAFVISCFYDSLAWIDEKQILINGYLDELREAVLMNLEWANPVDWHLSSDQVLIMNSCLSPLSEDFDSNDHQKIELKAGHYCIEQAAYEEEYCAILYRFTKLNKHK